MKSAIVVCMLGCLGEQFYITTIVQKALWAFWVFGKLIECFEYNSLLFWSYVWLWNKCVTI